MAYHIKATHAEKSCYRDIKSGEIQCIFFPQRKAICGLTRKESMRKFEDTFENTLWRKVKQVQPMLL